MRISEWERLFLRENIELFVRGGDVSLLAERAVLGMGSGYDEVPAMLEEREDVRGRARTPVVYTGSYRGVRMSAIAVPGGPFYTEWAVRVLGARRARVVVGVGYCGGLQEHVDIGDVVVPTAAPLRETEEFVRKWSEAGALAVDGECSALFTVSRFENIKAGAVLAVSDSPLKRVTHAFDEKLNRRCDEAYRRAVEAAFEAVVKLAE